MAQVLSSPQPLTLLGTRVRMMAAAEPSEAGVRHGEPSCLKKSLFLAKLVDASSGHHALLQQHETKVTLPTGFTANEPNARRGAHIR